MVELIQTHENLKAQVFGLSDLVDGFGDRYSADAKQARREYAAAENALIEFEIAHPEVLAEEDQLRRGSVVVRDPNSWSVSTGKHEVRAHCGHKHKTIAAAQACYERLTASQCQHGRKAGLPCRQCLGYAQAQSWSATWRNANLEDQAGNQVAA